MHVFNVAHPIRSIRRTGRGGLKIFDDLKLVRCPHSLAPTLVTLPSMSLIPFAPFSGDDAPFESRFQRFQKRRRPVYFTFLVAP